MLQQLQLRKFAQMIFGSKSELFTGNPAQLTLDIKAEEVPETEQNETLNFLQSPYVEWQGSLTKTNRKLTKCPADRAAACNVCAQSLCRNPLRVKVLIRTIA